MATNPRRVPPAAGVAACAAFVVSAAVLGFGLGSSGFLRAYNDLAQLVAAVAALVSCTLAAVRTTGGLRRTWVAAAVGCGGWAVGEGIWSWYELARHVTTPFPSLADLGFLVFPIAAGAALLLHPARGTEHAQGRRVLDALVATSAIVLVSWETALGAVVSAGGTSRLALAVSLAYPVSDIVLLLLVTLILSGATGSRSQLGLLAAGIAALSVSDSGFAYLTSSGSYDGGAIDLGWIAGFLLIALAPLPDAAEGLRARGSSASDRWLFLPYVPVAAAGLVTLAMLLGGRAPSAYQVALIALVVVLVLMRQYLTLHENVSLTSALAGREAELRHQAFHDALTGLANRNLFQDRLGHALDLHGRDLRAVAVLFLDLDDFKLVNDTLGHAAGDQLLVRVAERLLAAVRTGDTVARLGGDEFAILLEDGGDPVNVAAAVETALRPPFVLATSTIQVGASIGVVAVEPADPATSADALLAQADTAMYAAKRSGKGQLRVFSAGMALSELSDQRMGAALAAAVAAGELELLYQPVVSLADGHLDGVEALARWQFQGRQVPPSEFIAVAERTGVINQLTSWVLREACQQVSRWAHGSRRLMQISINVAPPQIADPAFAATVIEHVQRYGLRRGQLILEITETSLVGDTTVPGAVIAELRAAGVLIALDDFGVGTSSLSRLHAIELDILKIDRSFVDRVDTDPRQARLLRGLLRLGEDLGLQVVGEGVERQSQLDVLREMGCRLVQGELLAPPLPAEAVPGVMGRQLAAARG